MAAIQFQVAPAFHDSIRPCSVTYAFGPRDLRTRAIRNAGTVVKRIDPLAGLELVFDGHRAVVAANGHVHHNDVVWIIPDCTKRVPADDAERGSAGRRGCRSTAQGRLVPHPSFHGGVHIESCAAVDGQDAGSFSMDGKIPDVRVLAIGEPIIAESCPDLGPGSVT